MGPSKPIRYSGDFATAGFAIAGVCFPIFFCYSAWLSNVVRYNGVFVMAGFVITGCHCMPIPHQIICLTMTLMAGVSKNLREGNKTEWEFEKKKTERSREGSETHPIFLLVHLLPTSPQFFAHPRRAPSLARFFARLFDLQLEKERKRLLRRLRLAATQGFSVLSAKRTSMIMRRLLCHTPNRVWNCPY